MWNWPNHPKFVTLICGLFRSIMSTVSTSPVAIHCSLHTIHNWLMVELETPSWPPAAINKISKNDPQPKKRVSVSHSGLRQRSMRHVGTAKFVFNLLLLNGAMIAVV